MTTPIVSVPDLICKFAACSGRFSLTSVCKSSQCPRENLQTVNVWKGLKPIVIHFQIHITNPMRQSIRIQGL